MPFGWCSNGRLRPPRMVPLKYDYPMYEVVKMRRPIIAGVPPALRGDPRVGIDPRPSNETHNKRRPLVAKK